MDDLIPWCSKAVALHTDDHGKVSDNQYAYIRIKKGTTTRNANDLYGEHIRFECGEQDPAELAEKIAERCLPFTTDGDGTIYVYAYRRGGNSYMPPFTVPCSSGDAEPASQYGITRAKGESSIAHANAVMVTGALDAVKHAFGAIQSQQETTMELVARVAIAETRQQVQAELAQAEAYAQVIEKVAPEAISAIKTALVVWKTGAVGDLPPQPAEWGAARMLWDLDVVDRATGDMVACFAAEPVSSITPAVKAKAKALYDRMSAIAGSLDLGAS